MLIDLHTHTNVSDASLSRDELLDFAAVRGLSHIAITDHDSMRNSFCRESDPVEVIPGVELTCYDTERKKNVHVLCYCPKDQSAIGDYFETMRLERLRTGEMMLEKVHALYPIVNERTLAVHSAVSCTIYKPHIMNVLMDYGYTKETYGDLYRQLFGQKTGSCLVETRYGDLFDLLKTLRESRGAVVLAHPSVYDSVELAYILARQGYIDGIEINHPRNRPEDNRLMRELCREYGLVMTGGSDYHGRNSTCDALPGDYSTDPAQFERLMELADRK